MQKQAGFLSTHIQNLYFAYFAELPKCSCKTKSVFCLRRGSVHTVKRPYQSFVKRCSSVFGRKTGGHKKVTFVPLVFCGYFFEPIANLSFAWYNCKVNCGQVLLSAMYRVTKYRFCLCVDRNPACFCIFVDWIVYFF